MMSKENQQIMTKQVINNKSKFLKTIFNKYTFCRCSHIQDPASESDYNIKLNQQIIMHPKYVELTRQILDDLIDGDAI